MNEAIMKTVLLAAAICAVLPLAAQTKAKPPVPKLSNGKPDLSGVWDHPFVIDMSQSSRNDACGAQLKGCSYKGPAEPIQMTAWGEEWFKNYKAEDFDATAHCNPMGYTRSSNAPVPTQIVATPAQVVFLHESMFAFHVVYLDGRSHPGDDARQTTWYGHSVGKWEGDTLVIDTVGPFFASPKMILDTRGHPISSQAHFVERFSRPDYDTLAYEIVVEDPISYAKPFKNTRIWKLMPAREEIMEYVCTENNKEVKEDLISSEIEKQKAPPEK
jgi:hypothetical protein